MDQSYEVIDTLYGFLHINYETIVFILVITLVIFYLKHGANLSTGRSLNVVALATAALIARSLTFDADKTTHIISHNLYRGKDA